MKKYDVLIGGIIIFSKEIDYHKISSIISYLGYNEVDHQSHKNLQFNKQLQLTEFEFQEISDKEKEKLRSLLDKSQISYTDIILSATAENIP
ncbi:hypothetical protein [Mannheimia granulomatis]|uniref:hypothetical protein n=1 Tax=Mannheimia granulomatis TaxID=85402 RepID=UPI00047ADB7A|nr:hypothetical protein [Mannheimia granulomatis]QLB18578.1 hypothetical protein A6B41_03485 [Mannheimia granulomatis]